MSFSKPSTIVSFCRVLFSGVDEVSPVDIFIFCMADFYEIELKIFQLQLKFNQMIIELILT